jgi:hypothetical protein
MAFMGQVLLPDAPPPVADPGLVSFHYCLECAKGGQMSFGYGDAENSGYLIRVFSDISGPRDGHGLAAVGCLSPMKVAFSNVEEVPSLEEAWELGLELPPELFVEGGDLEEDVGLGFVHVARSKVGGWPTWQQSPTWPTCREGQRMHLVAQFDYEIGEACPWAGGGYAFVFACGPACRIRMAELVIQTT